MIKRIKKHKKIMYSRGYIFWRITKGFFDVEGVRVVYPVLWFRHKTKIDHGNALIDTVVLGPVTEETQYRRHPEVSDRIDTIEADCRQARQYCKEIEGKK